MVITILMEIVTTIAVALSTSVAELSGQQSVQYCYVAMYNTQDTKKYEPHIVITHVSCKVKKCWVYPSLFVYNPL